jgi:riboflavin synthase
MFTGIIESVGIIKEVLLKGTNKTFWVESPLSGQLKVDQSISHNGVCLTVEEVIGNLHQVTAIDETLKKTNLSAWDIGLPVNLERCLKLDARLDGHLVQGHVDTTAICLKRKEKAGSWEFEFSFPEKYSHLVIEKGSICVNGISLTAFNVKKKKFSVAIIPYTFHHTNMNGLAKGQLVNIEFDMVGKYINRRLG